MRYNQRGMACMLAFGFALHFTERAQAASWTVLNQAREVSAVVHAGNATEFVDDSNELEAPGFGLFDEDIQSQAEVAGGAFASASARAAQTSIISTNRITVSGTASAGASAQGPLTRSESDAFSDFFVRFELTQPSLIALTGTASSLDFGQVSIELTGPGISFKEFVQGFNDERELDQQFEAGAGIHTLNINTFADFEATIEEFGGQTAVWNLELSLIACIDPPEPEDINVFYGVDAGSSTVHRNLDLTGGAEWGSPGSMGAGLTAKGLSVNPLTEGIYVLVNDGSQDYLTSINPSTGSAGTLTSITNADTLALPGLLNIAFDTDGTLYCAYETFVGGFAAFGTVDPTGGIVTPVGGFGFLSGTNTGFAIDPMSRELFFSHGSSLNTVDRFTGALTPVALNAPPEFAFLAFDPTGTQMIAGTSTGNLVEIYPTTGAVTSLSSALDPPAPLTGLGNVVTTVGGGNPICEYADGDFGDTDGDGLVSSSDISGFVDCMTGPGGGILKVSSCLHADMQADGDVDLNDFAQFAYLFASP